jgi:hypothetical protein
MELNIFLHHSFLNPSFHCNLTVVYKYIHIFQNNNIYFGTCEYFKGIERKIPFLPLNVTECTVMQCWVTAPS